MVLPFAARHPVLHSAPPLMPPKNWDLHIKPIARKMGPSGLRKDSVVSLHTRDMASSSGALFPRQSAHFRHRKKSGLDKSLTNPPPGGSECRSTHCRYNLDQESSSCGHGSMGSVSPLRVNFSPGRLRGRGFCLLTTWPRVAVHDWLLVRLCGSSQTTGSEEKSGRET
jgi:hypothetical protein